MRKILVELVLWGNDEEAYKDVCDELVVEDFLIAKNPIYGDVKINLVSKTYEIMGEL